MIEPGQVTSGQWSGLQDDNQITVCDLAGIGVQDTAIANLAHDQGLKKGFGTPV